MAARVTRQKWARALLVALCALPLYAFTLFLSELAGLPTTFYRVPDFAHRYGYVFPGAFLSSLAVLELAPGSRRKGALWGAALAPLNAPFAVLSMLVVWQIQANLGWAEPWQYGWNGLFGEWQHQAAGILLLSLPIAIPCGLLLGAWLGQPLPTSNGPE